MRFVGAAGGGGGAADTASALEATTLGCPSNTSTTRSVSNTVMYLPVSSDCAVYEVELVGVIGEHPAGTVTTGVWDGAELQSNQKSSRPLFPGSDGIRSGCERDRVTDGGGRAATGRPIGQIREGIRMRSRREHQCPHHRPSTLASATDPQHVIRNRPPPVFIVRSISAPFDRPSQQSRVKVNRYRGAWSYKRPVCACNSQGPSDLECARYVRHSASSVHATGHAGRRGGHPSRLGRLPRVSGADAVPSG